MQSSKVLIFLTFPLINDMNLSFCLLLQILISAYQLLHVTQLGHFEDCWLCVPLELTQLLLTASPVTLPNNLTFPFTNCHDLGVAITSYLFSLTLAGTEDCFKISSGTGSIEKVGSLGCNITNTSFLPQGPMVQNTKVLCDSWVYYYLPASQSGVRTLVFIFSEFGKKPQKRASTGPGCRYNTCPP